MKNFWILILLLTLSSCQEEVELPLGTLDEPVPMIEATWTDRPNFNLVRISLAKNYLDSSDFILINTAEVFIVNLETNETIPFQYDSRSAGYRAVDLRRAAVEGVRYELVVLWGDAEYRSQGKMLEPPIFDSLAVQFQEERFFREAGYYIKAFGKIPFQSDNYYRIRVYENDTLKNNREDYLLFDDTFGVEFFEDGLELNYAFQKDDQVRLELFRMNKPVFDYFNQLVGVLFNDGGLFSPPPQNPTSTIRVVQGEEEVLGYFMVSPVLIQQVRIED